MERAALHHDPVAEFGGVLQPDDFEQGVFDDGNRDAGRNFPNVGAFLLHLLDFGIHKHRAAGSQVHRPSGGQAEAGEFLRGQAQGVGESFDERAAPRGAGLVEHDRVDDAVADMETLHVLPADVQYE